MLAVRRNKLPGVNGLQLHSVLEPKIMLMASAKSSKTLKGFGLTDVNGLKGQNNPWGIDKKYGGKPNRNTKINNLQSKFSSAFGGKGARITITKNSEVSKDPSRPNGFPSVFSGKNFTTSSKNPFGSGLSQSSIRSIPFKFNSNGGAKRGVYNNTIDIWLGGSARKANQFLMLQNYNSAIETTSKPRSDGNPGNGQPAGINPYSKFAPGGKKHSKAFLKVLKSRQNVKVKGLSGTYDIWAGGSGNQDGVETVSYIKRNPGKSQKTSGDLNNLIKDAVKRKLIKSTNKVTNVFAGSEIWSGGVGAFNELEINVNRKTSNSKKKNNKSSAKKSQPRKGKSSSSKRNGRRK
jgi:hypothetical protein